VPLCHPHCQLVNVAPAGEVADQVHIGDLCLRWYLNAIYSKLETDLHDLASRRARLMA
jgi:hypothetical protein